MTSTIFSLFSFSFSVSLHFYFWNIPRVFELLFHNALLKLNRDLPVKRSLYVTEINSNRVRILRDPSIHIAASENLLRGCSRKKIAKRTNEDVTVREDHGRRVGQRSVGKESRFPGQSWLYLSVFLFPSHFIKSASPCTMPLADLCVETLRES